MSGPVLVTGAGGLIGTELLPLLEGGSARVMTSGDRHRCDLSVPGEAAALIEAVRPGTIVHLAGGTSPDRREVYRKNVLTTVRLLDAAARLPEPPYCIVLGSAAEYGDASGDLVTESSPPRPVTEYGRAKLAQTTLAESICDSAGLPLTVLRPFNLVSSRLPPSSALGNLREQLLRGRGRERTVECGRLDVVRDFVPVSAVAEAIRRLVASPVPGQILNVCSGVGIELGAVLRALAERLGVAVRTIQKPELLAIPAAPRVVGDPSRLLRWTGMRIEATAEGLARLLLT
ncbi:MAG TPA: NAD-dependent epimerase/dehydratase family protein [Thermoanaerobaculia bacterium]|jgi:nucleoside-diphosphate-sugar epimerase|nr:NAD-dependent epimerase/dehydratase family protein [Thermoanaerobaculia bacterium]